MATANLQTEMLERWFDYSGLREKRLMADTMYRVPTKAQSVRTNAVEGKAEASRAVTISKMPYY
jgi:hypothetical protein